MKTIFIKEIQEHAKWAALMLAALAIVFACALSTYDTQGHTLVGDYILLVTGSGFPTIGFSLGLLLTLQESSPGRWGFLTHRTVSRARIFLGKLLAGAFLYLVAAGIPLGIAVWWVAMPGHVAAPFAWQMVLPRLADLFGGLMWLSAGMLVGARARWIGSRLMPAGMALAGSVTAFACATNFAEALLIISLVLAICLIAASGAFVAGNDEQQQPKIARWAAGLCVLAGLFFALGSLAGVSVQLLESMVRSGRIETYQNYQIGRGGRVVIEKYAADGAISTTDLDGNALSGDAAVNGSNLMWLSLQPSSTGRWFERRFQQDSSYLGELGFNQTENWFYVVSRRTIEGFDTNGGRFIGSIGLSGFVGPGQQPQPFPEPLHVEAFLRSSNLISSSKTAYRIDLARRTLSPIFHAAPGEVILASGKVPTEQPLAAPAADLAAVATRSAVHIFEAGKESFSTPLRHTFPEVYTVEIYPKTDGGYLFFYRNFGATAVDAWAYDVDSNGKILRETDLPLLPFTVRPRPIWLKAPALLAVPPALPLGLTIARQRWSGNPAARSPFGAYTIIPLAFGFVMLFAMLAVARRTPLSGKAKCGWAILTLLLGFPALVLLLSLFDRVALVPCHACNKRRLVTREHCEHCNAPFPPPPAEGIEVFTAPSEAVQIA